MPLPRVTKSETDEHSRGHGQRSMKAWKTAELPVQIVCGNDGGALAEASVTATECDSVGSRAADHELQGRSDKMGENDGEKVGTEGADK